MADDFEGVTLPSGYDEATRVLVAPGILARSFVVNVTLTANDIVEVFNLDVD